MRYELTDREWAAIKPMLPNKPRGAFVQFASIRLWLRVNESTS